VQPSIGYSEGMTGAAKKLVEELLKLSAEERSEAAEALLLSLEEEQDFEDPEIAAAWAREIERRAEENLPGIPAEEVFSELRARYQKP